MYSYCVGVRPTEVREGVRISEMLFIFTISHLSTETVLFGVLIVESRVSGNPGWPPTSCVAKDDLKFLLIQPPAPKWQNGRCVTILIQVSFLFSFVLINKVQAGHSGT